MKAGAQAIRREACDGSPRPREILRDRQRHVERVLGTGQERDQRTVAGVLDPVVDVAERCEIPAQNRRQRGLGSVLLGRRSLRVSDEVGEEEARDERAARRTRLGFGHGKLARWVARSDSGVGSNARRTTRQRSAKQQRPTAWVGFRVLGCLTMTYFRMGNPHYHRRAAVSRSCSGWEGVVPAGYGRQALTVGRARCEIARAAAFGRSKAGWIGLAQTPITELSDSSQCSRLWGQAARAISTG